MGYTPKPDDRDTSNGMTPAKSISRPTNPPVKPILGPIRGKQNAMDTKSN